MASPRYTSRVLASEHLQKLTARDVQGSRRINPRGRSHPNVHYVRAHDTDAVDRGVHYSAEDRNASILARIAEIPGAIRVRFIYGESDDDVFSTQGIRIKEYSWQEMRGFIRDENATKHKLGDTGLKAYMERNPDGDESSLRWIVWEKVG